MRQLTFEDLTYLDRKRKTRRQRFLERMDRILPWDTFLSVLRPHDPQGGNGRRPIPIETMLRIYFMQQWFHLSDPAAEDAILDHVPMRVFAGVAWRRDTHRMRRRYASFVIGWKRIT